MLELKESHLRTFKETIEATKKGKRWLAVMRCDYIKKGKLTEKELLFLHITHRDVKHNIILLCHIATSNSKLYTFCRIYHKQFNYESPMSFRMGLHNINASTKYVYIDRARRYLKIMEKLHQFVVVRCGIPNEYKGEFRDIPKLEGVYDGYEF